MESSDYYGKGYQDVEHRKPSIRNAKRCLNWEPKVEMEENGRTHAGLLPAHG
ncbi:hypothetical protein RKK42_28160 [Klebsiella pneumoniae]|nr:hypothetical protein [Klebsiella pneumoniae]